MKQEDEKQTNKLKRIQDALINEVVRRSYSHVDGRDLFADLKPRKTLDIKKRRDGVETWYEGDWLNDLGDAIRNLERHTSLLHDVIEELEEGRQQTQKEND